MLDRKKYQSPLLFIRSVSERDVLDVSSAIENGTDFSTGGEEFNGWI